MELVGLQSSQIKNYWEFVLPYLIDVQDVFEETFTLEELKEELQNKISQLWLAVEDFNILAVGITKILKKNNKNSLFFSTCAGENIDSWEHLMQDIINFAIEKNCEEIKFIGRRGWKRKLARYNYKEQGTIFKLELAKDCCNGNVI